MGTRTRRSPKRRSHARPNRGRPAASPEPRTVSHRDPVFRTVLARVCLRAGCPSCRGADSYISEMSMDTDYEVRFNHDNRCLVAHLPQNLLSCCCCSIAGEGHPVPSGLLLVREPRLPAIFLAHPSQVSSRSKPWLRLIGHVRWCHSSRLTGTSGGSSWCASSSTAPRSRWCVIFGLGAVHCFILSRPLLCGAQENPSIRDSSTTAHFLLYSDTILTIIFACECRTLVWLVCRAETRSLSSHLQPRWCSSSQHTVRSLAS
jgi:hypothetical protein